MASATNEADAIRRRMAQIRMELHEDVQGVVAGTEAAFDWQYYVRLYPWAALAGAVVVGYLIVPRKRTPQTITEVVESPRSRPAADSGVRKRDEAGDKAKKSSLMGMALGFLGPIAMRAAQNYAMNYVQQWIEQQPFAGPPFETAQGPGASPPPPGGPHGPYPV